MRNDFHSSEKRFKEKGCSPFLMQSVTIDNFEPNSVVDANLIDYNVLYFQLLVIANETATILLD